MRSLFLLRECSFTSVAHCLNVNVSSLNSPRNPFSKLFIVEIEAKVDIFMIHTRNKSITFVNGRFLPPCQEISMNIWVDLQ